MADCIFCKIIAGEIPCEKIIEDEVSLSLLDIGPLADGHTLLIPREHWQTLDEMPAETTAAMLKNLPVLVRAVQSATGCAGVNVLQNNGKIAHQEIPHVHFHIIPRYPGDSWQFNWPAGKYTKGKMEELGAEIRRGIQT